LGSVEGDLLAQKDQKNPSLRWEPKKRGVEESVTFKGGQSTNGIKGFKEGGGVTQGGKEIDAKRITPYWGCSKQIKVPKKLQVEVSPTLRDD